MATGSSNQHADFDDAEESLLRGADADGGNAAYADDGHQCLGDMADQVEGDDAAEHVDGEADGDAKPDRNPLYDKAMNFNRFIDDSAKGLDPISMNVWVVLFRFARGGIARASQETIARRLGVSPKTVLRHLRILKEKKLLRVVERGHRGGRCNVYQLGIVPLEPVPKRPERVRKKPR